MTWTAWAAWTHLHWTATAAPPHTRRCPEPPPLWPTRCRGGSSMRGRRRSDSSRRGRPTPSSEAAPPARRRACSAHSPRRGRAARGGSCERRRHTSSWSHFDDYLGFLYIPTWPTWMSYIFTGVYLNTVFAGLSVVWRGPLQVKKSKVRITVCCHNPYCIAKSKKSPERVVPRVSSGYRDYRRRS